MAVENTKKENKEPTMDPGEAAVLFGVVILCLLMISSIMVSRGGVLVAPDDGLTWHADWHSVVLRRPFRQDFQRAGCVLARQHAATHHHRTRRIVAPLFPSSRLVFGYCNVLTKNLTCSLGWHTGPARRLYIGLNNLDNTTASSGKSHRCDREMSLLVEVRPQLARMSNCNSVLS